MNKQDRKIINIIKNDLINLCDEAMRRTDNLENSDTFGIDPIFKLGLTEGIKETKEMIIVQYFDKILLDAEVESLRDILPFTK